MKKMLFYLVCVTVAIVCFACNDNSQSSIKRNYKKKHILHRADSALNDIALYDTLRFIIDSAIRSDPAIAQRLGVDTSLVLPTSYTIEADDFLAALGVSETRKIKKKVKFTRAYFGIRQDTVRLYIVPVDSAYCLGRYDGGKDILLNSNGKLIEHHKHSGETGYVLDLIAPCPKTCARYTLLPTKTH